MPVFNEARYLESAIGRVLRSSLDRQIQEILIVTNGCTDTSVSIAQYWSSREPKVRSCDLPVAGYGLAIREGILRANGDAVLICNADYWDDQFFVDATAALATADFVVGSKTIAASIDRRPWTRRLATWLYCLAVRILFRYRGSDTHGVKAMNRNVAVSLLGQCVSRRDTLDTEILIRAERAGRVIIELPTVACEIRPARTGLGARIVPTMIDLLRILHSLRHVTRADV